MSDINKGGEHWENDWIKKVESIAEKYGVECHGVSLNVMWFINLLDTVAKKERADVIEEVKSKMISFHTDAIFQYGADIIEAKSDAFDELKDWLKNQTT